MRKSICFAVIVMSAGLVWSPAFALALQTWQQMPMPTGLAPNNVHDIAIAPNGDVLVSYDTQGIWRSSDHGQTWQSIQYNVPNTTTSGGFFGFNALGEILYCPTDHNSQGIYRLPVGATSWSAASYDPVPLGGSGCPVRLELAANGDVVCLAAGNGNNRILRSTDGGRTFTYTPDLLGGGMLFSMVRNPVNANEMAIGTETGPVYWSGNGGLTFSDIQQPRSAADLRLVYGPIGQLFSSATHDSAPTPPPGYLLGRWTGGTNWVESDAGLPSADTRASATSASQMFVGNYDVYVSKDNGSTWAVAGAGFPTVSGSQHLRAICVGDDGFLYAGVSQGATTKGLWRLLAYLPGDANQDGKVTFADYIILANNFGQSGKWINGDFTRDGKVSFADYIQLANNFGQSIPEPATLGLLVVGGLTVLVRRKRN